MPYQELKITIHPDIVSLCHLLIHNKNFDYSSKIKDSITLVSENIFLKDQKKYIQESISDLQNSNTISSPFDNNLNCAVSSLILTETNDNDHKISLFSEYFSKFIEENKIQLSESKIELFLKNLIINILEASDEAIFEKYPLLSNYFTSENDILFLLHAKKLFCDFLSFFFSSENELLIPNDFIKALLSQLPRISLELYDEYCINEFKNNHATNNSKINIIVKIQKSNTARKHALIKAENERKQKENLRLLIIETYEKKKDTKEWHGLAHFYRIFSMQQNNKIKELNPNLAKEDLDKLLVKEGTVRKILKEYRDLKK